MIIWFELCGFGIGGYREIGVFIERFVGREIVRDFLVFDRLGCVIVVFVNA